MVQQLLAGGFMKSLSIDFKNKTLCIMVGAQEGTQFCDIPKEDFLAYIPKKYMDYTSYTWNFENETLSMNQEYNMSKEASERGAILTKTCFVPECIIPMPGLSSLYSKFLKILDLEEMSSEKLFLGLPAPMRKLLRL